MAQVGIKSPDGHFYSIVAIEQDQGADTRIRDLRFNPLSIRAEDCAFEPEVVRPVLQPGLTLTKEEMGLKVSVIEVSGTGVHFTLPRIRL